MASLRVLHFTGRKRLVRRRQRVVLLVAEVPIARLMDDGVDLFAWVCAKNRRSLAATGGMFYKMRVT